MTSDDATERVDETVADAIGALDDRRRREILFALLEAERRTRTPRKTLSFTELYDAVDVDSTSQFSYHLKRLVGPFLAETPDGYHLTYSGATVARGIRSGEYESAPAVDDGAVDGVCPFCGATALVAAFEAEQFRVRCEECESTLLTDFLPRSQCRGRTPDEIVESVGHRIWSSFLQLRAGVCPECAGRVESDVERHEDDGAPLHSHVSACSECGYVLTFPVEVAAAFHPAVLGRLWEHGISLWDIPLWEFFALVESGAIATDVRSTEPVDIRFELSIAEDRLRLEMDETLTVAIADSGSREAAARSPE